MVLPCHVSPLLVFVVAININYLSQCTSSLPAPSGHYTEGQVDTLVGLTSLFLLNEELFRGTRQTGKSHSELDKDFS